MSHDEFILVDYPEPHKLRGKEILLEHPQIRDLFGPTLSTLFFIILFVGVQTGLAVLLARSPWWAILIVSYFVGAVANHGLFVLIHEATHNLIFKGTVANKLAGILASTAVGFPIAMSFRKYHLLHHRFQGNPELDADLATVFEARLVGSGPLRKSLWLFIFSAIEGIYRPMNLKAVKLFDRWALLNIVIQLIYVISLLYFFGLWAYIYIVLSTVFSIGLHPLGARWIQEHYVFRNGQETYSYYGPFNRVAFNVGYHNEHHDFMRVPWSKLPLVRKTAPTYYDSLMSHSSWTKLLLDFLFNSNVTLFSRIVRFKA